LLRCSGKDRGLRVGRTGQYEKHQPCDPPGKRENEKQGQKKSEKEERRLVRSDGQAANVVGNKTGEK